MKIETETAATADMGSIAFRDAIVGKRIAGVIARPGRDGQPPVVLMLSFDDGSVVEFVSPRSDRLLRRAVRSERGSACTADLATSAQLELMPGLSGARSSHGLN